MSPALTTIDVIALGFFLFMWLAFEVLIDHSPWRFRSLTSQMAFKRREWMLSMADRDVRIVDTNIVSGQQQGSTFFGSASILAIGGTFAMLGSTDDILRVYRDLPVSQDVSRALFEFKVLGLSVIWIYAFFKFAWSYRLFNYCSILIGAVPNPGDGSPEKRREAALQAAEMNIIASRHFTAGLRGIFFALAFLGWFVGGWTLIGATIFVLAVLLRRQYISNARRVVSDKASPTPTIKH